MNDMDTVYVLIGDSEEKVVEGVFTSKEQAERYKSLIYGTEVQEFPLNPMQDEIERGEIPYRVWIWRDGRVQVAALPGAEPTLWLDPYWTSIRGSRIIPDGGDSWISGIILARDQKAAIDVLMGHWKGLVTSGKWPMRHPSKPSDE